MLTDSRKRHHSSDAEEVQMLAQAKRSPGHSFFPESNHDVWDSESSSSDSISSPERLAEAGFTVQSEEQKGKCLLHQLEENPLCLCNTDDSYYQINRILREAHFSSLTTRGRPGPT